MLPSVELYEMFDASICGGFAGVLSSRHFASDYTYDIRLKEQQRPSFRARTKPQKECISIDATMLYSHAMTFPLPYSDFRMLNEEEINRFDLKRMRERDDEGFLLECDLFLSDERKAFIERFPPLVHSILLKSDDVQKANPRMSDYIRESKYKASHKLVQHSFSHVKRALLFDDMLEFLIQTIGYEVTRIRRIARFNQKPILKPFVTFCYEKRRELQQRQQQRPIQNEIEQSCIFPSVLKLASNS